MPVQRVVAIVVARFRTGVSRSLIEASNHFAFVTSDARFGPLLQVRLPLSLDSGALWTGCTLARSHVSSSDPVRSKPIRF